MTCSRRWRRVVSFQQGGWHSGELTLTQLLTHFLAWLSHCCASFFTWKSCQLLLWKCFILLFLALLLPNGVVYLLSSWYEKRSSSRPPSNSAHIGKLLGPLHQCAIVALTLTQHRLVSWNNLSNVYLRTLTDTWVIRAEIGPVFWRCIFHFGQNWFVSPDFCADIQRTLIRQKVLFCNVCVCGGVKTPVFGEGSSFLSLLAQVAHTSHLLVGIFFWTGKRNCRNYSWSLTVLNLLKDKSCFVLGLWWGMVPSSVVSVGLCLFHFETAPNCFVLLLRKRRHEGKNQQNVDIKLSLGNG